ncbi:MAG TPA: NUDIX domain-containing protein [Sphingomicrobium sp.]|nr:NUDIX domain-containing protein [Sphingomicrobium sp.]
MEQEAIPAATLIVVRDMADAPPDLLIVERAAGMAFAGGALVFPGGRIDDSDLGLAGGSADDAAKIAAIRETLEETGIAVGLTPAPTPAAAFGLQDRLIGGALFNDLIATHGLALDLGALTPFARWKPAFQHARRFDTFFFIARAPSGDWPPRPQAGECQDALWLSATEVLARIGRGEASAIFPTMRNLERLAAQPDFAGIAADAQAHPIETITPWIEQRDGVPHIIIPDNLGYPVTSEPLSAATRG